MSTLDPALEKLLADLKAQGLPNYWKTTARKSGRSQDGRDLQRQADRSTPWRSGSAGAMAAAFVFILRKKNAPLRNHADSSFFHGAVPVEFSCYEDMNRGFLSMGKIASGAKRAIHQCATFLREV
ncbi:MAG: hypothetical protein U1F57_10170 [bacterium]